MCMRAQLPICTDTDIRTFNLETVKASTIVMEEWLKRSALFGDTWGLLHLSELQERSEPMKATYLIITFRFEGCLSISLAC